MTLARIPLKAHIYRWGGPCVAVVGPLLVFLTTSAWSLAAEPTNPLEIPAVEYNRDVRPILAENCFSCHGPDSASRKARLRAFR